MLFAQPYLFIEQRYSSSSFGLGIKLGRFSPNLSASWSANVVKTYDLLTDTAKPGSSYFFISPVLGCDFIVYSKEIELFIATEISTSFQDGFSEYLYGFGTNLTFGIEKLFDSGFALSGAYGISFYMSKYQWDYSNEYDYRYGFDHCPKISLKYYFKSIRKNS